MVNRYQTAGYPDVRPSGVLLLAGLDVLLVVFAAILLLPQNVESLFQNTDAELYYALDHVGREFGRALLFTNFNPVAVAGTLMSQLNPFVHPVHFLWYSTDNLAFPYVFLAVLLYLATFSLGLALRYPVLASRVTGYAIAVFWMPFWQPFSVDIMARICPWTTYILCIQLFAWTLFLLTGTRRRPLHDLLLGAAFCGTFVYAFLIEFSYAALAAPFSALFIGAVLASSASKRELVFKAGTVAACAILFVALDLSQIMSTATQLSVRMIEYAGHTLYIPSSSRSYLGSLLGNDYYRLDRSTLRAVPVLRMLALLGMVFGLLGLLVQDLISRRIFCITLASALGFFGLHAVSREFMVENVIWPWPAPAYFEWIGHPLYALNGITALLVLAGTVPRVWHRVRGNRAPDMSLACSAPAVAWPPLLAKRWLAEGAFLVLVALSIVIAHKILPFSHKNKTIWDLTGVHPPAWIQDDPISDALADSISLRRNEIYRGSFLSTLPDAGSKRSYQMRNFIPVMTQYHRGDTPQGRAILDLIHRASPERHVQLLRLFGVKYVQYSQPVVSGHLVLANDLKAATELNIGTKAFLYRVLDPNLRGFAPTAIERVESWKAFVDLALNKDVDWSKTAFFAGNWNPPRGAELTRPDELGPLIVTAEGMEFSASSPGISLVVLPRSFSNCYYWRPMNSDEGNAELVRVNLIQLGVMIRGAVRGRITIDMEWGKGAGCLAEDIRDLYRIGLLALATPEALHPKGYLGFFGRIVANSQQRSLRRILETD